MIILGIDPGFADMGYGIIQSVGGKDRCLAYGSLRTPAGEPAEIRLASVYEGLSRIIDKYKPEMVAIEKLFFSKNVKTAMLVAEARGVIRVCVQLHGIPCTEFSPADVKMAVSGNGAASKEQVQKMVRILLGLKEAPKPDDAADGLALAIALSSAKRLARAVSASV
jgi:crossover junction endodeoxyribonuclease RuvC